jgi:hypothetical protein
MEAAMPPKRIDEFLYKEIRSEMKETEMKCSVAGVKRKRNIGISGME